MIRPHADDLGLHPAVDRAVFRAFEAGAVAGASILATGPTFRQAAHQAGALGIPLSLHLAIVDTAPLSPPCEIPSLVNADGRFPPYFGEVLRRTLLGRLSRADLRVEVRRQLERFGEAGLASTEGVRLDGHQHLHLLPPVLDTLLELAAEYRLTSVRLPLLSPHERRQLRPRSLAFLALEQLGRRARVLSRPRGIDLVPCWGVLYAGHLTLDVARAVLASLPPGSEGQLLCHPGDDNQALATERAWGFDWETDFATVLALATRPGT